MFKARTIKFRLERQSVNLRRTICIIKTIGRKPQVNHVTKRTRNWWNPGKETGRIRKERASDGRAEGRERDVEAGAARSEGSVEAARIYHNGALRTKQE